ncbi:MAG: zf-HC2 domain-containing protein, partial [Ruminococcaceae bacterium]|nr:zf-HC2 domain-containing protein [Oscillospiraceae bacterium]
MNVFCNKWQRELLSEQDNELDAASLEKLQAHLDVCADCRAERELLLKARSAIAPLRAQRLAAVVPAGLSQLVMAGLDADTKLEPAETETTFFADSSEDKASYWSRPGRQRSLRYASALLLVFLVVTLVFVYRNVALSQRATSSSFAMATTAAMAGMPTIANDSGAFTTGGRQETNPPIGQESATTPTGTRLSAETRTSGGMTIYGTTAGTTAATTAAV